MLSYNQLIKAFKAFQTAHHVLNNFGNGERWLITDKDQTASFKYPLMWVEDSGFSTAENEFIYSFRIWFVTRVEAPNDRGTDLIFAEYAKAKSDMVRCAQDFISYWMQDTDYPELSISESASLDTFIETTPDRLTGCSLDISFSIAFDYNNCILPMDGVPAPPSSDVTVTVNGTSYFTLTCGDSGNVVVKDTNGDLVGSKIGSEWIVPAAGGGGSFTYDVYFDGVDTGQDVTVDGSNITINLT